MKELDVLGNKVVVIDDYLNHSDYMDVYTMMTDFDFNWNCATVLSRDPIYSHYLHPDLPTCEDRDNLQLVHMFYDYDRFLGEWSIHQLIDKIMPAALIRIKANLNPRTTETVKHGFHIDNNFPNARTAVYYVNSNDGFTEFEDGTKVESVENRIVIFDSHLFHTGTTCTNYDRRLVVNVNYFPRSNYL